jgi:transcription elongation factor GreB
MSRHRPPEETRSNYITPEGAKKLRFELDFLWKEERPRVTQAVSEAAAQGDRSENADYIYGKRRLREIDQRIRHLTLRLDAVKVVAAPPTHTDRVFFGAWVRLENDAGDEAEYRIVGPDEFDVARGCISMDAPMGRALMGKRAGDEVVVQRPVGMAVFTIIEISYQPFTPE